VAQNSSDGEDVHEHDGGHALSPLGTLTLDFSADEAGSDSNAAAGEIDTLVTTMLGVTCSNDTLAALGIDEESDESLRERCRAKLGMLSPNGPARRYNAVVRDADADRRLDDHALAHHRRQHDGRRDVYVAGALGRGRQPASVSLSAAPSRSGRRRAASPRRSRLHERDRRRDLRGVAVRQRRRGDGDDQGEDRADLAFMFATRPIGGDIIAPATTGKLYKSLIEATIKAVVPGPHVPRRRDVAGR
jgi:hypothetical protein